MLIFSVTYYVNMCVEGYHLNRALAQFHNPVRKDFVALFIHHWTTLSLIFCSFVGGKTRCGCIILSIHESADIFLEAGKICLYCSYHNVADFLFIFFTMSWIGLRMISFCTKLLIPIYFCGVQTIWLGDKILVYSTVCIGMLYVLEALHIYWFMFIVQMIQRKFAGHQIRDVRSGSETEDAFKEKEC